MSLRGWRSRAMASALSALGDPPLQLVAADGSSAAGRSPTRVTVRFNDDRLLPTLVLNPDLTVGDAFAEGRLEVEGSLLELLEMVYLGAETSPDPGPVMDLIRHGSARLRRNSLVGSRKHIHHHYDLGNDFYSLWLDEYMQSPAPTTSEPI